MSDDDASPVAGQVPIANGEAADQPARRTFLSKASSVAMLGGLATAYGAFGATAVRYVYPAKPIATAWLFVRAVADLKVGDSIEYRAPNGATVVIARQGEGVGHDAFIALSSTCPHLGCKVSWEGPQNRFFCPCHNGTFDARGEATGGPPFEAKQSLPRYPLQVTDGLLFIEVSVELLAEAHPSDAHEHEGCSGCAKRGRKT